MSATAAKNQTSDGNTNIVDSPEVIALKQEKEEAELFQAAEEAKWRAQSARAAARTAELSMLKSQFALKEQAGDITKTGSFFESKVIAHMALEKCLINLIKSLFDSLPRKPGTVDASNGNPPTSTNIIFYNDNLKNQLIAYDGLITDLDNFKLNYGQSYSELKSLLDINFDTSVKAFNLSVSAIMVGTYALLQSAAGLRSAFNVDKTYNIDDLTISEPELIALVSKTIRQQRPEIKLFAPDIIPLISVDAQKSQVDNTLGLIRQQYSEFLKLKETVRKLKTYGTELLINETDAEKKQLIQDKINTLTEGLQAIESQIQSYTTLNTKVYSSAAGENSLVSMAKSVANLKDKFGHISYIIQVIAQSSGSYLHKKGWFVNKMEFSGGSIVSALLYDNTGAIVSQATHSLMIPLMTTSKT